MKFLILLIFVSLASCSIEFSNIKPVTEILEWQEAFPEFVSKIRSNYITYDAPQRAGRVIRGTFVGPLVMPYQVGIIIHFPTGNGWCGGSLVSRTFVLSAANCFPTMPQSTVLVGASDITIMSDSIPTSSILRHPQFRAANFRNDIALVQLSRPAHLNPVVQIIRLPNLRQNTVTFNNHLGNFGGWGRTTMVISLLILH